MLLSLSPVSLLVFALPASSLPFHGPWAGLSPPAVIPVSLLESPLPGVNPGYSRRRFNPGFKPFPVIS